jgi:DNA-binding NarL/FixJ family response regulator
MSTRIILVDDVDDIRELVRYALSRHGGFEVIGEAGAGREAIHLAATSQPDIVLLDLGLPDIAGDEVLTTLRDVAPDARVVVFTGQERHDHAFFEEYADGYVTKGTDLKYLVGLLENVGRDQVGRGTHREAEAEFDLALVSVPQARAFVEEQLVEWGAERFAEAAALVVSELATNAVVHAHSRFAVRLKLSPAALRIEIADSASDATPELREANQNAEGGRGLLLVSAVSSSWGVEPAATSGKVTWAELTA